MWSRRGEHYGDNIPTLKMVLALGQRWEIYADFFFGQMQLNTNLSEMCSGHQANILLLDEGWSKGNCQAFVQLEFVHSEEKRVC